MNPLVVLKLLDLAMLGFTAFERYQAQKAQNEGVSDQLSALRNKILSGELSTEEALKEIDVLIGSVINRRHAAFDALPKPPGHS